ncbi:hypothetical protein CKAH01_01414 [Colletotrichum kahawae]|uniref:Uncharacterized protein n=1 Tax=Colletotrichum kahawae TaxID=34407 RepID=A0AAD9Y5H3_COLKA|nr:hypothetical protein CKAH01_01414 [Colletotrichum kahawae]
MSSAGEFVLSRVLDWAAPEARMGEGSNGLDKDVTPSVAIDVVQLWWLVVSECKAQTQQKVKVSRVVGMSRGHRYDGPWQHSVSAFASPPPAASEGSDLTAASTASLQRSL